MKNKMKILINLQRAMALRYTGAAEGVYSCHPRQMMTNKPLNINDEDIFDGMSRVEQPLSQPTVMSYLLQRIRLAEISRSIVDRTPLIMANLEGPSRDEIMDMDTELQMLINDVPPFFSMSKAKLVETYKLDPAQAANILHQGFIVYFFLYAKRSKLHLPYFTRGYFDTSYSSSREICVKSARLMIQSELRLEKSGLPTATRYKFVWLLLGVFIASIVLLIDISINKTSPNHDKQRQEVSEAFRMLEQAKQESEIVAEFVDSLMHLLRKHKIPSPRHSATQQIQTASTEIIASSAPTFQEYSKSAPENSSGDSFSSIVASDNGDLNMTSDGPFLVEDLSTYFNDLAQSFEQGIDAGNFDLNNIFSGLGSSFI
jgi:hypothetical protein